MGHSALGLVVARQPGRRRRVVDSSRTAQRSKLARELLARGLALPEVAEHVRRVAAYRVTNEIEALQKQLAERGA